MANRVEQVRKIQAAAAAKAAELGALKREAKARNEAMVIKVVDGIAKKRKCGCC